MNILGVSGSPHDNGNTAYAVRYALDILSKDPEMSTSYISLAGKNIHPCDGCWGCSKEGRCKYEDDGGGIVEALKWCHALILGSPVYMGMVSGQMKVMMDRCVVMRVGPIFEMEGKVGCGIACGAFRNGGQELTLQCIHTFMLQQNMRVISDGAPYSHSGAAIAGEAKSDELGLKTVANLARNMARMLRADK